MYCLYTIEIFSTYCHLSNKTREKNDLISHVLAISAVVMENGYKFQLLYIAPKGRVETL
jgi:hypothetical protein